MRDARPEDATPDGVEVSIPHAARAAELGVTEADVRAVVAAICELEDVGATDVSVVLADRALVHTLNRTWLEHDYPTDVLSFSLDAEALGRGALDGEVYVDLDTAAERAPEFDTTARTEALRYVAHGLLHLAGWDDTTDELRAAMRSREDAVLTLAMRDE